MLNTAGCLRSWVFYGVRALFCFLLLVLAVSVWTIIHIRTEAGDYLYVNTDAVPPAKVAIIFGASVHQNTLSSVLEDRVQTGIELYQKGKVRKLLMSGDNRFRSYNEPVAMRRYAVSNGVPVQDIVLDYAGRNTYDSCYRAKAIFGVDSAVLVTQTYHLPRALYTARALGIDAVGVSADHHTYPGQAYYSLREQFALLYGWVKVHVTKPVPILGSPLPIDLETKEKPVDASLAPNAVSRVAE